MFVHNLNTKYSERWRRAVYMLGNSILVALHCETCGLDPYLPVSNLE